MVSAIGGIPGSSGVGLGRVCAIARMRPALTWTIAAGAGMRVHWDSLATTEALDGPPPLYGTCSDSMPALCWKYAPARWPCAPAPAEAILKGVFPLLP